jgi:hypothetical protein
MKTITFQVQEFKHKRPQDAMWYLNGTYYKAGTHNFIFQFDDEHWIKSSLTARDIKIMLQEHPRSCRVLNVLNKLRGLIS